MLPFKQLGTSVGSREATMQILGLMPLSTYYLSAAPGFPLIKEDTYMLDLFQLKRQKWDLRDYAIHSLINFNMLAILLP